MFATCGCFGLVRKSRPGEKFAWLGGGGGECARVVSAVCGQHAANSRARVCRKGDVAGGQGANRWRVQRQRAQVVRGATGRVEVIRGAQLRAAAAGWAAEKTGRVSGRACQISPTTPHRSAAPSQAPRLCPHHKRPPAQHGRATPPAMVPKQKHQDTGELMVSIEQYTKTRDSVCLSCFLPRCDAPALTTASPWDQARPPSARCCDTIHAAMALPHAASIASSTRLHRHVSAAAAPCAAPTARPAVAGMRNAGAPGTTDMLSRECLCCH